MFYYNILIADFDIVQQTSFTNEILIKNLFLVIEAKDHFFYLFKRFESI